MKPEFSEILLPAGKLSPGGSGITSSGNSTNNLSNFGKWLAISAVLFALAVTIITTASVVRYEDKFNQYELRITALEDELEEFYKKFIDEGQHDISLSDYDMDLPLDDDEEEDEERERFGEVRLEEPLARSKRQIPIPATQVFGSNVERTKDGVPILSESYLDRVSATVPSRFSGFQHQSVPSTDSEGLRLYEGLVASGGRNEPKSPDFVDTIGDNGIQPHHRNSAAWSEKTQTQSNEGLQLKSGDTRSSLSVSSPSSGPQFADEIFYSRSSRQRQSSSSTATGAGSSAVYNSGSTNPFNPGSSGTFHRASRVPATGEFLYPQNTRQNTRTRSRSYQYPPLKKLGQGDGEVVARVLQSENEGDVEGPEHATASANYGETATAHAESTRRKHYRRHNPVASTSSAGSRRHGSAKLQRKVNRSQHYRKFSTSTVSTTSTPTTTPVPVLSYEFNHFG